jgi:N-acetylglucosaminyl-diphospho-decaprenol L-rhamnosyltransferase
VERLAVSVIVVTWNAGDVLGACLDSVARQRVDGGFETIVVDSGSTDGTAELLRGRDDVVVVSKEDNIGFSAGNNEAAAMARGETLFFLNSDTELLDPDTLATLARTVRMPGVGLAGPRLQNPDGSLQPSCAGHLGVRRALLLTSGLHKLLPDGALARLVPERWSHDSARDTGWLMGAALAVRADAFAEAGGFWPTMYAEDEDLAYRVQRRGLAVRYEPSVRVMHIGNHSLAKRWSDAERAAEVAKAEVAFVRTHFGRTRAAATLAILAAGHGLRLVAHGLLGRRDRARVYRAMARVYASREGRVTGGPQR